MNHLWIFVAGLAASAAAVNYNSAPPDLNTLPENSLFETWRPKIHVLPPNGQIGDPCAHYVDSATGTFHVSFLHNGSGIASVYTNDLVTYSDVNPNGNNTIIPGGANDPLAVFDGSVIPIGIDNKPTLLYTSVTSLPIHWTLPYKRGSETQSLAVTYDGGHNFTKLNIPPVISEPPQGLNVTAFRDPYVFQSRKLDTALGSAPGSWYVTISGGVHNVGPHILLYRQKNRNLEDWEYLGRWWHEPMNSTWGNGDWAKVWGFNFETGNVFGLDEQGYSIDGDIFITLSVEGSYIPIQSQVSSMHGMLWAAGYISNNGSISFTPTMAGVLDWGGSSYAAAGKVVPATSQPSLRSGAPDRFIIFVWLSGDHFGSVQGFPSAQQSWMSILLLPRELSRSKISNVVYNKLVEETGSWRVQRHHKCPYTILARNNTQILGHSYFPTDCAELVTLGIEIARETYQAMISGPSWSESGRRLSAAGAVPFERSPRSKFFILEAQIYFPNSARNSSVQTGFEILSSALERTLVYYQFSNESIIIDRSNTSAAAKTTRGIETTTEAGRLRLFDIWSGRNEEIETLDLTVVVDNSVLEVYANSRFVLSTWVR